ncbi:MAG TPA: hypothetical protein VGE38_02490 [Nocardioides sp.]|uniref:hypothetical protein n=1 Tax=Nocardioides sp. TaxID=35761 RepID=UPI002EDB96F5
MLRTPHRWRLLLAGALVLAPLHFIDTATGSAAPATPPTPGSLTRFVSWGDAETALGEYLTGLYTSDPDGSDPAPLVKQLRPYTEEDANSGLQRPVIEQAAVSPDGLQVAAWVQDLDGFVVPGGTPQDSFETESRRTGEVLALFSIDGTFVRVLVENRQLDPYRNVYDDFWGITWVDEGHVLVSAYRIVLAGTEAETTRSVLHSIDVATGAVASVIAVQDGTLAGPYTERGWAGGGTIMAISNRTGYVFHPGDGQVELPKALVTDDPTHEGYEEAAVSPDGQHIAVTYGGERTEAGVTARLDVFDRIAPGTWDRRSISIPGQLEARHVTWLPYDDFADAEVLVDLREDPDATNVAAALRVGPGVSDDDRLARTYPAVEGSWAWQPVTVPAAGAADVRAVISGTDAVAGQSWTGTVTLQGRGPDTASDVRLDVEVDGEPATGLAVDGGTCEAGSCTIPDLAAGESAVVTISTTYAATGVRSLVTTLSSASPDWNAGNDVELAPIRVRTPEASGVAGRLLYQTTSGGSIVTGNPDGTGQTVLATPEAGEVLEVHEVHHRTGLFLWSRSQTDGGGAEYVVSTLSGEPVRSHTVSQIPLDFAVSPDGRTAYYVEFVRENTPENFDDEFRLMELRLDLPGAEPRERQHWSGSLGKNLRVSPDGTRLAYVVQPIGGYINVAVATELDFRKPVVLNPGGFGTIRPNDVPAWSPDSATVALSVGEFGPYEPEGHVVAFPFTDPTPTSLATMAENLWLGDWAPDGTRIILVDLGKSHAVDVSTGAITPLLDRPAWWTGQAVGTTPTPTATATSSPTSDPTSEPTSDPTSTVTATPTATTSPTSSATSSPTPSATSSPRPPAPAPVDVTVPTTAVAAPPCGGRKGRACTSYLKSPRAWSRLSGTVGDAGGSGVASVTVTAVQKRGKAWYAYNGRSWSRKPNAAKASAAAKALPATVSGSSWSLKLKGVRAGKLTVSVTVVDGAGNAGTSSMTRTLR